MFILDFIDRLYMLKPWQEKCFTQGVNFMILEYLKKRMRYVAEKSQTDSRSFKKYRKPSPLILCIAPSK